jgi:hypothetical protein
MSWPYSFVKSYFHNLRGLSAVTRSYDEQYDHTQEGLHPHLWLPDE